MSDMNWAPIVVLSYRHITFMIVLISISKIQFQYNIKKKEELVEQQPQEEPNPLMRKKKTPEELAAEAEQEDLDDFTSKQQNCIHPICFVVILPTCMLCAFYLPNPVLFVVV